MQSGLKSLYVAALCAALAVLPVFVSGAAQAQVNADRPGGDYARLQVPSGDPADCALLCERDRGCRAWSFVYPSDPQAGALCWLKASVPARVTNSCCVSGVRGAGVVESAEPSLEMSIDRFGGDLRAFWLHGEDSEESCKAACTADGKCRAWTFARAGYVGREPRCFLKDDIKPPHRKPGFVSGVVR